VPGLLKRCKGFPDAIQEMDSLRQCFLCFKWNLSDN
jgi:hypothetical protein